MFQHADEGTFVSLRTFLQTERGLPSTSGGMASQISEAVAAARFAANTTNALVFAPPIATFRGVKRADEMNLASGVVTLIARGDTTKAREHLEALLGPATVVVASGGPGAVASR